MRASEVFWGERKSYEIFSFAADTKNERKSFSLCICFFFPTFYCFQFLSLSGEEKKEKQTRGKLDEREKMKNCAARREQWSEKSARNFLFAGIVVSSLTIIEKIDGLEARWLVMTIENLHDFLNRPSSINFQLIMIQNKFFT